MGIKSGDAVSETSFTGLIMLWALSALPDTRWLECDNATFDMDTYTALADLIKNTFGQDTGTVITADASTNVITATSHGLSNGNRVVFTNSGGALPGGISANTIYFVISATTNTFKISTVSGGSEVDITSNGTGTNRFHNSVRTPDFRGRVPIQLDTTQTEFDVMLETGGAKTHTLTEAELASHTHGTDAVKLSGNNAQGATGSGFAAAANSAAGGGAAHNNLQPYLVIKYIIHV